MNFPHQIWNNSVVCLPIEILKEKIFLLRQGEVCRFEAFVIKGLLSVYHTDVDGFDKVLYFTVQDWWLTDIDSFTNQKPSQLYIEALEDRRITFNFKNGQGLRL